MKALYALYSEGSAAQRAVDGLRAAGMPDSEITVITGEPMEDFEFSHIGQKNNLWYVACGGGLLGFTAISSLAYYTSTDWPMNVGNMATVSGWAFLVPIFEVTMLGAILATVFTLIASSGLARRRHFLYDPEVTSGKILVGVEHPAENKVPLLENALRLGHGATLKTL